MKCSNLHIFYTRPVSPHAKKGKGLPNVDSPFDSLSHARDVDGENGVRPFAADLRDEVESPSAYPLPLHKDIGGFHGLPSVLPTDPLVEEGLGGVEGTERCFALLIARHPPLVALGLGLLKRADVLDVPIISDLEEHALADDVLRYNPIKGPLRGTALEQDARTHPAQVRVATTLSYLLQLGAADADRDALAATGEEMHAHDIAVTRIVHLKDPAVLDVAMHDSRDDGVQVVALHGGVPSLAVCVALIIATYNTINMAK